MSYYPVNPNGQATMANSAPVVIASDQSALTVKIQDGTSLLNATISSTGAGTAIDTLGFATVVIQITGASWSGQINIEGSNDNSNWGQIIFLNADDLGGFDSFSSNGSYIVPCSLRYIRLNPASLTGSFTAVAIGKTSQGLRGSDQLALAMDKNTKTPLQVEIQQSNMRQDSNNALVPSDIPSVITASTSSANTTQPLIVVDSTGYQSLSVHVTGTFTGLNIQVYASNDDINFINIFGYGTTQSTQQQLTATNTMALYPCMGKWMRVVVTAITSGTVIVTAALKQTPVPNPMTSTGISFINGGSAQARAVAGVLSVEGYNLPGEARVAAPMGVAGTDVNNIVRSLLTDSNGRILLSGLAAAMGIQNLQAVPTSDITQQEGQSQIEILQQMLMELKVVSRMLTELPLVLNGQQGFGPDEPEAFRADSSIFTIN
jgi:hypothetical protein